MPGPGLGESYASPPLNPTTTPRCRHYYLLPSTKKPSTRWGWEGHSDEDTSGPTSFLMTSLLTYKATKLLSLADVWLDAPYSSFDCSCWLDKISLLRSRIPYVVVPLIIPTNTSKVIRLKGSLWHHGSMGHLIFSVLLPLVSPRDCPSMLTTASVPFTKPSETASGNKPILFHA